MGGFLVRSSFLISEGGLLEGELYEKEGLLERVGFKRGGCTKKGVFRLKGLL